MHITGSSQGPALQNGGNPTESTPRKLVASKAGVCSVCRCCNDNIFERKHPIDLYGAKATKESILSLLERLVGYKCHIEDGMPSKACRPCYDKIMKFKKFKEIIENSTAQQRSIIWFKRGKSKGDSPSLISSGHARKSWPNQTIPVLLLSPCPVPQKREDLCFLRPQDRSYLPHQFQCQNR